MSSVPKKAYKLNLSLSLSPCSPPTSSQHPRPTSPQHPTPPRHNTPPHHLTSHPTSPQNNTPWSHHTTTPQHTTPPPHNTPPHTLSSPYSLYPFHQTPCSRLKNLIDILWIEFLLFQTNIPQHVMPITAKKMRRSQREMEKSKPIYLRSMMDEKDWDNWVLCT